MSLPTATFVAPSERETAPGNVTIRLTNDGKRRLAVQAIEGSYWSKDAKSWVTDNPSPRTAAAIIALFPDALVDHPELQEIRDRDYADARPYDYASELGMSLDEDRVLPGGRTLYKFQDRDIAYLQAIGKRDGGAFIGWDRGLGKTTAAAAIINSTGAQRSLIVTRNDTKTDVWFNELSELLPDHDIRVLPNAKAKREKFLAALAEDWTQRQRGIDGGAHRPLIVIIHYEAVALIAGAKVVNHHDGTQDVTKAGGNGWAKLGRWEVAAYDEGHRLASYNPNSSRAPLYARALSKMRKQVDLALNLTGSAIQNHAEDLFGQLHFLYPTRYRAKWRDWNDRFIDYVFDGHRKVPIGFLHEKLPELQKELGVFMVYRRKEDVFDDLPPIIHTHQELELYPEQRKAYDDVLDHFWTNVEGEGGIIAPNAMSQINLLRQIATYLPGLPSAKLDFALADIKEDADNQYAVFTWYKAPGRRLAEMLEDAGVSAVVVDGDLSPAVRDRHKAQHRRGEARVLIGSIATIGESLNLQYMHEAFRLDRDWNPQVNGQTVDRLHRNGQTARVNFRDLWAKGTVDLLRVKPTLASKDSLRKAVFGA
jgi:hypothetical protein